MTFPNARVAYAYHTWLRVTTTTAARSAPIGHAPTALPPLDVFCWRITGNFYGFRTEADREAAQWQISQWAWSRGIEITFTKFREKTSPFAAQIIFWNAESREGGGGFRLNGLGRFVSSRTGKVVECV